MVTVPNPSAIKCFYLVWISLFVVSVYKYSINENHLFEKGRTWRHWTTSVSPYLPNWAWTPLKPPLHLWPLHWRMHFLQHECEFSFSFTLNPDPIHEIFLSCLTESHGVHGTRWKPGLRPQFTQCIVLCSSTWEMMAVLMEMGAAVTSTTAVGFCFLCQ